jgi:acyl-coenzyme A synthetase/AMP-(fatty) acid ligase
MSRFKQQEFVEVVQRFQITDVAVVPPIITALLELGEISALRSLRYILCAGAPMNAEIQDKFYELIHLDGVAAQVWGTTETGWITAFGSSEKDSSGSVGKVLEGAELKIVDEQGDPVAEGTRGEACIRTPSIYSGYLGPSGAPDPEIDNDGYYHTGDLAYLQDGKVFIDGRIKDIMKVNGWQVSPAELETVLLHHPDIIDVAVVGKEHTNNMGLKETLPRAFVQRRRLSDAGQPSIVEEDVKSFLAERVMSYKKLSGGVVFVNNIPRNPTGKILRHKLEGIAAIDDAARLVAGTVTREDACPPELKGKLRKACSPV